MSIITILIPGSPAAQKQGLLSEPGYVYLPKTCPEVQVWEDVGKRSDVVDI